MNYALLDSTYPQFLELLHRRYISPCYSSSKCKGHRSTSAHIELNLRQVQAVIEDMHDEQRTNMAGVTQDKDQGWKMIQDDSLRINLNPDESLDHTAKSRMEQRNHAGVYGHSLNDPTKLLSPKMLNRIQNETRSYAVKISNSYGHSCRTNCRCACHRRRHVRSPRIFEKIFGSLFVGYVGLPVVSSTCDVTSCMLSSPSLWFDYYFPAWFLKQKLHCLIKHRRNLGPEQSLRVTRIVSYASDIILCTLHGDVENMRLILSSGSGSPFDTDGRYPILHVRCFLNT